MCKVNEIKNYRMTKKIYVEYNGGNELRDKISCVISAIEK